MAATSVLTRTEDIYHLLLRIAQAPESRDLQVEMKKTADGTGRASIGGGVGGVAGAAAGAILFGPVGAVVGAALGAAACTSATTYGTEFKSLPELLREASRDDRQKMAEAARAAATLLSIRLTWELVVPYVTANAQTLLLEVLKSLDYTVSKS